MTRNSNTNTDTGGDAGSTNQAYVTEHGDIPAENVTVIREPINDPHFTQPGVAVYTDPDTEAVYIANVDTDRNLTNRISIIDETNLTELLTETRQRIADNPDRA